MDTEEEKSYYNGFTVKAIENEEQYLLSLKEETPQICPCSKEDYEKCLCTLEWKTVGRVSDNSSEE